MTRLRFQAVSPGKDQHDESAVEISPGTGMSMTLDYLSPALSLGPTVIVLAVSLAILIEYRRTHVGKGDRS